MNLILERGDAEAYGVFGTLCDENDNLVAYTLEHAFPNPDGSYGPKLAVGTYECRRGQHRLHGPAAQFTTFEITQVPDFQGKPVTGILFHCGNFNADSEGCVLVGTERQGQDILHSRAAFEKLLELQTGSDTFTLIVK